MFGALPSREQLASTLDMVQLYCNGKAFSYYNNPDYFLLSSGRLIQACDVMCLVASFASDSLRPHGLQQARFSRPSMWWCHPTISSSVVPFSSCLQSFPASGSFPMSQFFTSGGQSIGASDSTLVLPMNIQGWFPLGLTGLISLQSKGFSRVFCNTTVQKHQFSGTQLSL